MAHTTINRGFDAGLFGRIAAFAADFRESRQRYRAYRQTVRELEALSDRELHDLGLGRASIDEVAMDAAYGK
ncbi:MAG: DUF1127 domain-containing protein [Paracoccaceae bacterium]|jgi:uncharacterized protein YjiS (DUF1127 family)|nr:DUF1127 domain-containing protein [Paracoccaceae bacterium]